MNIFRNLLPGSLLFMAMLMVPFAGAQEILNEELELKFKGNILAAPCTVDLPGGDAGEITVKFDPVTPNDLASAGSAGAWKDFSLKLKDCGTTTARYKASFSGSPATAPALYKNTGTATNVEIELQLNDGSNTRLGNGTVHTGNITSTEAELNMKARPYSSTGGATSGTIAGIVQINFDYE